MCDNLNMPTIDAIDFHTGNHIVQVCGDILIFFKDGDTTKPGLEIGREVLSRILRVAEEQLER